MRYSRLIWLSSLFAWLVNAPASAQLMTEVPILLYHQISTPDHPLTLNDETIDLSLFAEEMKYLHDNNYRTIGTAELVKFMNRQLDLQINSVVLHFDDGWKSALHALPILQKYDFKATFWIIVEKGIGGDNLEWDQLVSLSRDPHIEIYSHTMTHPWSSVNNLRTWAEGKNPDKGMTDIDWELQESRRILEERLSRPIPYLAWPSGYYNDILVKAALRAGYSALFTVDRGTNEAGGDVLRIHRSFVSGLCGIAVFRQVLEDGVPRTCQPPDYTR
jgi:peptidoglycan/xylan/chitin deacetylase (PgdA/CDA1 family)